MVQESQVWQWLAETNKHTNNSAAEADQNRVFSPYSPFAHFNPNTSFQPSVPGRLDFEQPAPSAADDTRGQARRYERRPRHKTRENRYECKAPGARTRRHQQLKTDGNNRAQKHNRKHTLNENFRAGNVASGRLTLNTRLNLGVFKKGRASSPTRPCILTGPAFSEVDFLSGSQQNRQGPAESCDKGKNKATDQTKHGSQIQISQYFSNDYPEDDLAAQATYSVKQDEPGHRSSCVPQTTVPTSQQDAPPANVDDYACKNDRQSSCSATLLAWLERVPEEYLSQNAPKPCTKGALCADLSHKHISNEEKENKRYWDLWELKLILQIRQEAREKMERKKRPAFYEDILKRKRQASEAEEELTSPPRKPRTRPDAFTQPVQSRSSRSPSTLQSQAFVLLLEEEEEELGRSLGDLLQPTAEEDPWFFLGSQPPELTPGDEMTASMESLSLESTSEYPAYTDNIGLFPDSGPIAFEHVPPYSNDAEYAKYSIGGAEDLGLGLDMLTRTDSPETLYDSGNDVIMKGVGAIFDRGHIDSANRGGRPSATDQNDPLLSTFGQDLESSMMPAHYHGPFPDESTFFGQPIQHVAGGHSRRNSLY